MAISPEFLSDTEGERLARLDKTAIDDFKTMLANSIPDVRPLSFEESRELSIRIKKGTLADGTLNEDAVDARDTLVFSCKGIIFKLASVYSISKDERDDLIQVGFLRAQTAALGYDPDGNPKKAKFSTYAHMAIRHAVIQASVKNMIRNQNQVLFGDIKQEDDEEDDLPEERIIDSNAQFGPALDEIADENSLRQVISKILSDSGLTEKQFAVLTARFVAGHPQHAVAKVLEPIFSKRMVFESVRQIEKAGLKKMKTGRLIDKLRPFLENQET